MKGLLLRMFYFVALYSGIISLFYWSNRHKEVVICYHNVVPDELFDNAPHLSTSHSTSVFQRQIEIIAKRWPAPRAEACLITFDDGYANQFEIAAPILNRHNRLAVFFVTLDLSMNRKMLWPDRFLMWVSYVPIGTYQLLGQPVVISDNDSRLRCWHWMWQQVNADYNRLGELSGAMDAAFPFDSLPVNEKLRALRFEGMTLPQIRELARTGHRIGCHSYRHDILSRISDTALSDDFSKCENAIGEIFNCDLYAYPFGGLSEVTERERAACRGSRFRRAFLYVARVESPNIDVDYAIPRLTLPNTANRPLIEARLSGFESFLREVIGRAAFSKISMA